MVVAWGRYRGVYRLMYTRSGRVPTEVYDYGDMGEVLHMITASPIVPRCVVLAQPVLPVRRFGIRHECRHDRYPPFNTIWALASTAPDYV